MRMPRVHFRAFPALLLLLTPTYVTGQGPTTTVTFELSGFTEVAVSSVFNVEVTRDDAFLVEVTIDSDAVDRVDVTRSGPTLRLSLTQGESLDLETIQATITMPAIDRVDLDGVINLSMSGFDEDALSVRVDGVSSLTGQAMTVDSLSAEVLGVSELDFAATSPISSATVEVEGVSQATLNMDVGADLSGAVRGTSTLFYFGTDLSIDVVTDFGSSLVRLGDTQSGGAGFGINAGLSGGWFEPATSGQGFVLEVLPVSREVFLAWFTFETESVGAGKAVGDPAHRWLTAQGPYDGDTATLDVTLTTGGRFDDPAPVSNSDPGSYGTITLTFENCATGQLAYDLTREGLSGSFDIERIASDNVGRCEALR